MKPLHTRNVIPFTGLVLLGCATAMIGQPSREPVRAVSAERGVVGPSTARQVPSSPVPEATSRRDISVKRS